MTHRAHTTLSAHLSPGRRRLAVALGLVLVLVKVVFATNVNVGTDAQLRSVIKRGQRRHDHLHQQHHAGGRSPAVQKSVTILGNNHTLSGNDLYRGFFVANFNGGGAGSAFGSGIFIQGDTTITFSPVLRQRRRP